MQTSEVQPKANHRYQDHALKKWVTKILPGEYFVTNEDEYIITILGSCIGACIYDTKTGIGGMNHFMLPASESGAWAGASAATRYGNFAMEHLINDILKKGANKHDLVAKIYGGSNFTNSKSVDVGRDNISFAKDYLKTEGIKLIEEDLGGTHSRKIAFHPNSGDVQLKKLDVTNNTIQTRDSVYKDHLKEAPIEGEVTLF